MQGVGDTSGPWKGRTGPFPGSAFVRTAAAEYNLLPLARMLARAANGRWATGYTIFVVSQDEEGRQAMGLLW